MSAVIQRSHLDWLESEAIFILREVAAESENPVLLFSGGKDSVVLPSAPGAFRSRSCTSIRGITSTK
jgi:3'-phosphoadenosine 5'-phosphosulfate sulfotransferase (PAPS reductase)/FAD synthetase